MTSTTLVDLAELEQRHPRLKGIAGFWQRELAPALTTLEQERQAAVRTFWLRGLIAVVALLGILALLIASVELADSITWIVFLFFFGCFGAWIWAMAPLTGVRRRAKAHLVSHLCGFYKLDYDAGASDFPFEEFMGLRLLPSHTRRTLEDAIKGSVEGVPLQLCEARLIRRQSNGKGGSSNVTVFHGLLLATPLPGPPVTEPILLLPDWGRIGNFLAGLGRKGRITDLDADPEFERRYEVYAADDKAARARLNRELQACLLRLAALNDKTPSIALAGDKLLLALPRRKNAFEGVKAFQPFDRPEPLQALLDDLELLPAIVEALALPPAEAKA
jgi:hypothetical protein